MRQKLIYGLVLTMGLLSFTGCAAISDQLAKMGTKKWLSDNVSRDVDYPRDKVMGAVEEILPGMHINIEHKFNAGDTVEMIGRNADGKNVWIDVRYISPNATRVNVRVGHYNSEDDARVILEQISKKVMEKG